MYKKTLINFTTIHTLELKLLNNGTVRCIWIQPIDPNK